MRILYYIKRGQLGFGKDRIYVTGKMSANIKKLTKRESLTDSDLDALKALGHTLMEVSEPQHG